MKHLLLLAIGLVGLVATVFALRGGATEAEKRIEYYANGHVQVECELSHGVREGLCRRYWPDGKLMAEGQYSDGLMSGSWTFWNQDGTPDGTRTGKYVGGEFTGG